MVIFGVVVTLALGGAMLARGSSLEGGVPGRSLRRRGGGAETGRDRHDRPCTGRSGDGGPGRTSLAPPDRGRDARQRDRDRIDKTGTLTENRLRLAEALPARGRDEQELLAAAALASTARFLGEEERLRAVGDPVDAALASRRASAGSPQSPCSNRRLVRELPSIQCGSGCPSSTKRRVGLACTSRGSRGRPPTFDVERRRRLAGRRRGRLGLQGTEGARRRRAPASRRVRGRRCSRARSTARRTGRIAGPHHGRRLPLPSPRRLRQSPRGDGDGGPPITAKAIGRMLDLPEEAIHARVTPAEKLQLVESLQAEGEVLVAVTGDGVNDAPPCGGRTWRCRDGTGGRRGRPRGRRSRPHGRLRDHRRRHSRGARDRRQHPEVRRLPSLAEPGRGRSLRHRDSARASACR